MPTTEPSKKVSRSHDRGGRMRGRGVTGRQVYEEIKSMIRRSEFGEGEPLSENTVSRRLNVSRTPVREALLRLKSEGWIRDLEGQGLVVNFASDDDLQDTYVLREALEGAAARLAARNGTQPELFALREIAKQFAAAAERGGSDEQLQDLNDRFHKLLYRSSHSTLLERILEPMQIVTHRDRRSLFGIPERARDAAQEHLEIAEAVVARDCDRSEEVARLHVRHAGEVRARLVADQLVAAPV